MATQSFTYANKISLFGIFSLLFGLKQLTFRKIHFYKKKKFIQFSLWTVTCLEYNFFFGETSKSATFTFFLEIQIQSLFRMEFLCAVIFENVKSIFYTKKAKRNILCI